MIRLDFLTQWLALMYMTINIRLVTISFERRTSDPFCWLCVAYIYIILIIL